MMCKVISFLFLVISISGCSTIFTNAFEVEPNVYEVTVYGNAFNSHEAMVKKALQKAEKKCGHNQFTLFDHPKVDITSFYSSDIGGKVSGSKFTIKIDCNVDEN